MTVEMICHDEGLRQIYEKVVAEPNRGYVRNGFIKCPECSEEILMVPTLSKMNEAIENHVRIHKDLLKADSTLKYREAIHIRLVLMEQVLQQASSSRGLF
jgi:hypothetical protein